ncbi:MAG: rod shape-determining protein RodA [Streptosporangiales bacterium]|nr:rod shape-determining protein RodA [Streptosporangiales bacterium]
MSVGIPPRGFAGPRAGAFMPRRRSLLARGLDRGGLFRSWDWLLIGATLALTGLGIILVWAATQAQLLEAGQNPHAYLNKAIIWSVLGVVLMFATASVDWRQFRRWTPLIYTVSLLLLLAVLVAGSSVNGAKAWINLPGGFQVEPSEFAKLAVVLATAALLSRKRDIGVADTGRASLKDIGWAVLAAAPLILLVQQEPALGVMLVLVFTLGAMIVLSGLRLYWIGALAAAAAIGLYGVINLHILKSYQITRFTAFLHPNQNLSGTGYNGLQAKIAVGSGGLFGQGLFHGQFTGGNFVPSVQTDFIFTVAGEELGFVGCAVLVALLAFVVWRAIAAAQRADDMFGMLVASGVAVWFAFQTFVNVGMTVGIMPITGLPLPFISYGGSAIFADMIAVGLLLSVRRHRSLFT